MFRLTAFLFRCLYSLVAKRQPYESARVEKAVWLLGFLYVYASVDAVLAGEQALQRLGMPSQWAWLGLFWLGLVAAVFVEIGSFRRHRLAAHLERYRHDKGGRRVVYALGAIPPAAAIIALPFSGLV